MNRRNLLAFVIALISGRATAGTDTSGDQWYSIESDDGSPIPNLRLPVEITSELDEVPGLMRLGSGQPDVSFFEFYDYNCPFCRKAAGDLDRLLSADPNLRLVLVNNPILSPQSKEAAKVALAVFRNSGSKVAYDFHKRLYALPGRVDGAKALAAAVEMGLKQGDLSAQLAAPEIAKALKRQMQVAASLGFAATPSFLVAGAGVLGYPGPRALARIIASVRRCDQIAC